MPSANTARVTLACALFSLLFFSLAAPAVARADDDYYTFIIKKQEDKDPYRWSLSQWLETRDRMRLMDLWLALHSPSPYEFYIDGGYQSYTATPGGNTSAWTGTFAAYATIFGLELNYAALASAPNQLSGLFDLRVFGYNDQATNLTLQAGLRSTSEQSSDYRNGLAGVKATIYLARHFGIQGLYRHVFASTPTVDGYSISGNRYEGGAFVDFSFVRLYGIYFTEPDTVQIPSANYGSTGTGVQLGTRLYF